MGWLSPVKDRLPHGRGSRAATMANSASLTGDSHCMSGDIGIIWHV